jgi:hypothetical protein
MRQPPEYSRLWRDINRELWRAAADGKPPKSFVRAELWRRVDHARVLEKSAAIKMARKKTPPCAIFKACLWLVETGALSPQGPAQMPSENAADPKFAARLERLPEAWPGVEIVSADNNATFAADSEPLVDHFQLFVNAFIYAAQAARNVGLNPHQIDFDFDFSRNRWSAEGTVQNPVMRLKVNFFYICANPKIWNAIFEAVVHSHLPSKRMAERYAHSTEAQAMLAIYTDITPSQTQDVYDLSAMFDALNAEYFNGQIPKPLLAWTTRANYRTLGTYNFHWNIITISRIMNDPRVPEIAVRFVLYHEMLHIRHGARRVNGRFMAHTPEVQADEKRFEGWEEANRIHQKLRELVQ